MRSKFKWIFTLVLALSMQFSFAQEKTVTGVVSDATGPLPGANVVIKGTTTAVQTDLDGKYSIKAKAGDVLVFSFIGMAESTAKVGASNTINIKMQEAATKIAEVVVGALGIRKKKDALTSSTQVVGNKELTQAANPNVVQSLAGKVSGLVISKVSGGVNGTTRIQLRGSRSITGNNEALVVIDNAISTATVLQQLPPEIIENVTVIKGAQGAALYGEQGVNGVIVVTTSKGKKGGKVSVSVNSVVDFEEVAFLPQDQEAYGQGWFGAQDFVENGGWGALFDGTLQPTGLPQADGNSFMLPYSPVKDNVKDFYQKGVTNQNSFSINSGDENSFAILTASKVKTEFVVEGDKLERNSFVFKAGKKIGKVNVEGNVNYIAQKASQTSSALLGDLLQNASNVPVKLFRNSGNEGNYTAYYKNPYWTVDNVRQDIRRTYFNGIATLNYEINKNININYTGNVQLTNIGNENHTNEYKEIPGFAYGDRSVTSLYTISQNYTRSFYGDLLINFDYMLNDNFNLKVNVGNNIQDRFVRLSAQGGTALDIPGLYNVGNVTKPYSNGELDTNVGLNGIQKSNKASVFANADLAYKDYLFLNATIRNDWSSVLDPSNNSFLYPSVGLSWVPTKTFEGFGGKVLNYMKLSASYVMVGNSGIAPYAINNTANTVAGFPFGSLSAYQINQQPTDKFITPEFVTTTEFSVDLGFFKNRITLAASTYVANTSDLITFSTTSSASGLSRYQSNIGDMQTKGFEIDLGITPIKTENFSWNFRTSYTTSESIITALSGDTPEVSLLTNNGLGVAIVAQVGQPFPLIKGTTYVRDPNGNVIVDAVTGLPSRSTGNSILGKATPDYILGLTNNFEYKGIRLTAVMDYRTGHQIFSATKSDLAWSGHLYDSALFDRDQGFIYPNSVIQTSPGVYTPNTGVYTGKGYGTGGVIDYYGLYQTVGEQNIVDATTFKLRELSLSYALPSKMLDKTGISSLRFGVNARNLIVALGNPFKDKKTYDNKGYTDPESSAAGTGNGQGYSETAQYPSTRTIGGSVNITF